MTSRTLVAAALGYAVAPSIFALLPSYFFAAWIDCKHNYEAAQHLHKIICKFICTAANRSACFRCHAHGKQFTIDA